MKIPTIVLLQSIKITLERPRSHGAAMSQRPAMSSTILPVICSMSFYPVRFMKVKNTREKRVFFRTTEESYLRNDCRIERWQSRQRSWPKRAGSGSNGRRSIFAPHFEQDQSPVYHLRSSGFWLVYSIMIYEEFAL